MAVKISAQKFLEGLMSLGLGAKQGQQQGQQLALQRQDQEQQRLLSLLPQLARLDEQRRAATTEPLERALGDPNLDPASRAQVYQQLQLLYQGQGASPLPELYGKAIGGQLLPQDLLGFGQGGGAAAPDLSALKFRDPRAEADADRVMALKRGLVTDQASQYENQSAFAPFIQSGEIPLRPDIRTQIPVPGGMGAMAPVNIPGRGERIVPAGAGELVADKKQRALSAEKQADRENRLKLADKTAERMLGLGGLRLQGQELALYKDVFKNDYSEYGDGARANQNALAAVEAARQLRPGAETGSPAAGMAPADAQAAFAAPRETSKGARVRQGDEKIAQGAQALDLKEKDTLSKITDRELNAKDRRARADAYTRKVAADLDPNVVGGQAWMRKNTMEARQNTEARLARQAAGGGGAQKWNPGLTARVDAAENAVKNAETVLAKTISAFQKEEADAAKASGMPSKHNYVVLDLDKLDKDLAAGKIKPTMKVGGKDVPNPQYDKFVRLNNLYRGVKVQRQELNKTLDKLAPVNAVTIKPGTGSQPLKTGLPDVNERVRKPSTPLSDVERKAIKMLQGSTNPNAGRPFTYAEAERLIRAQR